MSAADTASPPQTASAPAAQPAKRVTYTSYEANSWRVTFEQSGVTVLVDPWLVGDLSFGEQYWIYRGEKDKAKNLDYKQIAAESDFIVITQGLDDHCHAPTMEALPRDIPIVAAPGAAAKCRAWGYKTIYELDHGQTVTLADGKITVTGAEGALVGPPWEKRQLGVLLRETATNGVSLFYEPHADYKQDSVASATADPVDILITPVVNQNLLAYPLVCGDDNSLDLVKTVKPKVVIPFMNAEMQASGPLSLLVKQKGSLEGFRQKLQDAGLADSIRIEMAAQPPNPKTIEI